MSTRPGPFQYPWSIRIMVKQSLSSKRTVVQRDCKSACNYEVDGKYGATGPIVT